MKTLLKYILILLIASCDTSVLDENDGALASDYYIIEGWTAVESDDYLSAIDFFSYSASINQDDSDLLLQSLEGLSWSQMLYGSSLFGQTYSHERRVNRKASYDSFFRIDSILSEISEPPDLYDCDINAGKILYSDYQIYYYNNQYFGSGAGLVDEYLDSLNWFSNGEVDGSNYDDYNSNGHIERSLEYLVENMETNCPLYSFEHANINTYGLQVML